ncbi:YceI family protein [Simiduia sp. 21SJ11W-1]|uniref:YceI family protein n=1 Tax=Simiduia sp. 21SJ11W-1 TaxID=2909669 RepID=UPI0020A0B7B3|nr:YceI family protein [Simiduia sp. 21SJ11W-1]UTA48712.1 YceI family protein [Simiduia sp. 21SJ11W-1]
MKRLMWVVLGCMASQWAWADWALDAKASSVQFVSVKNAAVTEVHHFTQLTGAMNDAGEATLNIDLASVETGIAIRNERMQKMLFNTAKFASAQVAAKVDLKALALKPGEFLDIDQPLTLTLHGTSKTLSARCRVTALAGGGYSVVSLAPVLVQAADFGLAAGVQALQAVAKLSSIATQVPVQVALVYRPNA